MKKVFNNILSKRNIISFHILILLISWLNLDSVTKNIYDYEEWFGTVSEDGGNYYYIQNLDQGLKVGKDWGVTSDYYRSYICFDITSIPSNANINSIKIHITRHAVSAGNNHLTNILGLDMFSNPGISAEEMHDKIGNGNLYLEDLDFMQRQYMYDNEYEYFLGPEACNDFKAFLTMQYDFFPIGFSEKDDNSSYGKINQYSTYCIIDYDIPESANLNVTNLTIPDLIPFSGNSYDFQIENEGDETLYFEIQEYPDWIHVEYPSNTIDGGESIDATLTIDSNLNNYERSDILNFTNSNNTNDQFDIAINQEALPTPTLSNGYVTPNPGTSGDTFDFYVTYTDPTGNTPSDVKLQLTNQTYSMSHISGSVSTGAVYKYSTTISNTGTFLYHFEANSGQQRFPETIGEFLHLNVNQSTAGWDLRITDMDISSNQLPSGEDVDVEFKVHNNSSQPSYIYENVDYDICLYSPSGILIDSESGTTGTINQTAYEWIEGEVTVPSESGIYTIVSKIYPDLDEDFNDNSMSRSVIVGVSEETDQWLITGNNAHIYMGNEYATSYNFSGDTYTITYISSNYVRIQRNNGYPVKVYNGNFTQYDGGNVIVYCEWIVNVGGYFASISFGSINPNYVTFEQTEISCFRNDDIEFIGYCNYIDFENSNPDFLGDDAGDAENWFEDLELYDNDREARWKFGIPNNASTGDCEFYLGAELDNNALFIRELIINVLNSPPSLSSLSNSSFSADDQITINGSNLGSSGTLYFGSINCSNDDSNIDSWSNSSIEVIVPEGVENGDLYVTNSNGTSNSITYSIISSTGDPEVIQSLPDQSMTAGTTKLISDLANNFWDPNGDDLNYNVSYESDNISYSFNASELSITANDNIEEEVNITVEATDADDASVSDQFTLTITDINDPPQISSIPHQSFQEDSSLEIAYNFFDAYVTDVDNAYSELEYDIINYDPLTINLENDVFTITAPENWYGTVTATLSVSDGEFTVNKEFTIEVIFVDESPIVQTNSADNITAISSNLQGTVNPNGLETLYYFEYGQTLDYNWQTVYQELEAIQDPVNVTAQLNNLEQGTEYHYRLVASNEDGTSYGGDKTFTTLNDLEIVVQQLLPENFNIEIDETETVEFLFSGYDPDGNPLEYTWQLDGNTVSTDSTWQYIAPEHPTGEHVVTLEVTDNFNAKNTLNYTWNLDVDGLIVVNSVVPDPQVVQNIDEADTLTFIFDGYDPDGNELSYNWQVDNRHIRSKGNSFDYIPDYQSAGTHTVSLQVTDNFGSRNSLNYEWQVVVSDVDRPIVITSVTPDTTQTQQMNEDETLVFEFVGYDPDGNDLEYHWYLDGTERNEGKPENLVIPQKRRSTDLLSTEPDLSAQAKETNLFEVSQIENGRSNSIFSYYADYQAAGSHTLLLEVTDNYNSRSTLTIEWDIFVSNVDREIVVNSITPDPTQSQELNEMDSMEFVFSGYDPDGNELEFTWTLDDEVLQNETDSTYVYTPDYLVSGAHTLELQVSDNYSRHSLAYSWDIQVIDVTVPGFISGYVSLYPGGPHEVTDATIAIDNIETLSPNEDGYYLSSEILPGYYDVTVSLPDYFDSTKVDVTVYENTTTDDVNFTLYPCPILTVEPDEIYTGILHANDPFTESFVIRNDGPGLLSGNLAESADWISSLSVNSFDLSQNEEIEVVISGSAPEELGEFESFIQIESNIDSENLYIHGYTGTTGIIFSLGNPQIMQEDGATYLEFDVMAKASETGTKIGSSMIYLDYNDLAFGNNLTQTNGIEITKGELLQGELAAGLPLYNIVNVIDNNQSRFAVTTGYNYPSVPNYGNELPIEPMQLLHLSLPVLDNEQNSGITFYEDLMNEQQYLSDETTIYLPVIAEDMIDIQLSNIEQNINLLNGWNMSSFYVEPTEPDMQTIFQPLIEAEYLEKVQDEAGASLVYLPGVGWYDSIGDMQVTEGYMVNVNQDCQLSVTGVPVPLPVDIPLLAGWNIMGYPCPVAQNAMTVLQPLIDEQKLVKVQDEAGAAIVYLPGVGWYNSIGDFMPGEGYYINVNSDATLTIYEPAMVASSDTVTPTSEPKRCSHFQNIHTGRGYKHMSLILQTNGLNEGDEVAVYDGDICVGSAVVGSNKLLSVAASCDDPLTEVLDGFIPGNQIYFKAWNSKTNSEYTNIAAEYKQGSERFTPLGTAFVDLKLGTGETEPQNYLGNFYPNPFKTKTEVSFSLKERGNVEISIYNIKGQKVKTLVDGMLDSKQQKISWDGCNANHQKVSSGIYFFRMKTKDYDIVKKITLIR